MRKKISAVLVAVLIGFSFAGCSQDSDVASKNLSKDADNYKVFRQIVVYNAITDKYVLEVKGFCALGNSDRTDRVSYTCKVGGDKGSGGFIKDIILKSDNTFVFVHQLEPHDVSTNYYKVTLKPTEIIPDFEFNS